MGGLLDLVMVCPGLLCTLSVLRRVVSGLLGLVIGNSGLLGILSVFWRL